MKKVLFLFVCLADLFASAQVDTVGLSQEIKDQLIYMNVSDTYSSTTVHYTDGSSKGSGNTRRVTLTYTVGSDKTVHTVDKDAEHLKSIISTDRMALSHFNKAQEYRRNGIIFNVAEIGLQITALSTAGWAFVRFYKNKSAEEADKKPLIVPISISLVSFAGFYYCWFKSHKCLTQYKERMVHCVNTYNKNIVETNK